MNQASCSISSLRMRDAMSYVRGSLPKVMSQISIQLRIAQRSDSISRVRIFTTQFVDTRHDQLPMGAILQACVLADLLVVFVSGKVHAKDGVVIIGAGK